MRAKMYAIAITRFFLSLIGYVLYLVAFPLSCFGYLGDMFIASHSAFVTSTKQLLAAFRDQFKQAE